MDTIQDDWWHSEFSPPHDDGATVDYLGRNGKTAVKVQRVIDGSRGIYSAVMQLAIFLERNPAVERACLVLNRTRMSLKRLQDEWQSSKKVLRSLAAQRLCLIVVGNDETWVEPDEPFLRRIARVFEEAASSEGGAQGEVVQPQPGRKVHEVWKVLLNRWFLEQGPIALGELAEQVGCSYPTVRKALAKPALRRALQTASNRSVELKAFPHDAWRELLALSEMHRNSMRYRDRSEEKPTPQGLLKRLERNKPLHLALGGVIAARHWHSNFDLHGTPRLDVVCHAPTGKVDLEFVKKLDPALTRTDDPSEPAVLVVHPLIRSAPLFTKRIDSGVPWADPVETALDLCDLSLTTQANQLLTHLRPEVRLA
jgi:hypothetical protein